MKKIISFVGLFAVLGVGIGDAHGVAMSAQVRRLLQEKQEKIAKLEECEGKKQGWMIAGISTIGLTAVGVGVNIAQASKKNRLSDEIEMEKTTLQRQQDELDRIQNDIAAERAKQAQQKDGCCDKRERCCKCGDMRDGDCPDGDDEEVTTYDYSIYTLDCDTVKFSFLKNTGYEDDFIRLNTECIKVTGENMERTEDGDYIYFECKNYKEKANCGKQTATTPGGAAGSVSSTSTGNSSSSGGGQVVNPVKGANGGKKDGKKSKEQCVKTHGEYLSAGCVCESGTGLIPVLDDAEGKRYCGCGMSSTWDGQKCVGKKDEQKPAEKPVTLDAAVAGIRYCYYAIDGYESVSSSDCSVSKSGDWGVTFPDYTVFWHGGM